MTDHITAYYRSKGRDLPSSLTKPLLNADLIQQLDHITIDALNDRASWDDVDQAFEAVLAHPQNTFTREVLNYRQRVTHYS